ncbi:hypothetical protein QBC45DRAFT_467002 [Copromyces sp. CBS 386.78]|nr:hypothetical protein QBC45DRAFT_467002 [Copromyces sp. CBS 386.78]
MHGTEKVLREEAARLGLKAVIIRAGVHCETNQYAADGTLLTYYDPRTGRKRNKTAEDDPHVTVYMGKDLDSLTLQGHVYIVWDTKVSYNMRLVRDPSERVKVQPGREAVPSEYWYL